MDIKGTRKKRTPKKGGIQFWGKGVKWDTIVVYENELQSNFDKFSREAELQSKIILTK